MYSLRPSAVAHRPSRLSISTETGPRRRPGGLAHEPVALQQRVRRPRRRGARAARPATHDPGGARVRIQPASQLRRSGRAGGDQPDVLHAPASYRWPRRLARGAVRGLRSAARLGAATVAAYDDRLRPSDRDTATLMSKRFSEIRTVIFGRALAVGADDFCRYRVLRGLRGRTR